MRAGTVEHFDVCPMSTDPKCVIGPGSIAFRYTQGVVWLRLGDA